MHYQRVAVLIISILSCRAICATNFIVTNTSDAGTGSLRQAITNANSNPGNNSITFNIPITDPNYNSSQGVWVITPQSTLPMIMSSNLLIDGTSQTLNQGNTNPYGPEIMLDGNHAYGSDYAFNIFNVSGVIIQGFIIGRFTAGIEVTGTSAANNMIRGNYIGCNFDATDTLSNTHGIEMMAGPHNNIIGGSTAADRNILSGNNHTGLRLVDCNNNVIKGNFVGLNRTGTAALRNYDGISIEGTSKYNLIGGYTPADRNYVSGNDAYGIPVFGARCFYNKIVGNYAGTDTTGSYAIPNTYGVLFDDGASYNMLGGRVPGAGNLLSGNSGYGVFLYNPGSQHDTVMGNLIGTNADGTSAIPNANGIVIDGPSYNHIVDSNVISGNSQNGIDLHLAGTDSNLIIRNFIGTNISGVLPLPNMLDGVRLGEGPCHNIIGRPGKGNIIACNAGNGVSVMTAAELYNTISANSMFSNGGLGIDLFPEGVTLNDAGDGDSGPNDLLNFPVIDSIHYITGHAVIYGHDDVPSPSAAKVELFIAAPDITGYGEGKTYLGFTFPSSGGAWQDTVAGVLPSDFITSTSTDSLGNTSEFSFCYPTPPVIVMEYNGHPLHIIVRPDPFSDLTEISITGTELKNAKYTATLYNIAGKLLETFATDDHTIRINGINLAPGLYLCYITINGKELPAVKLIKR